MKYGKVELQLKQGSFIIDSPPVLSGTGETEDITAADTVISADYLNRLCRVNVASGSKIYLPSMNEASDGNRLTVQNISTSNYFWLYQNSTDGYSIDGNDMILVPPKATVDLIFAYGFTQWTKIGGHILYDDLTINIDNTWDLQKVFDALPKDFYSINDMPILTLQLANGTYTETSRTYIHGFNYPFLVQGNTGGAIDDVTIDYNSCIFDIRKCKDINVRYIKFNSTNSTSDAIYIRESKGQLNYLYVFNGANTGSGIVVQRSKVFANKIYFKGWDKALVSLYEGELHCRNTYYDTTKPNYGRYSYYGGKIIENNSTQVSGSTANRYKETGGQIILSNGQAWKNEDDIASCRVNLTATQNIYGQTWTKLNFRNDGSYCHDYGDNWDNTNHRFTAPYTGWYMVTAKFYANGFDATKILRLAIARNGTREHANIARQNNANTGSILHVNLSTAMYAQAGDTIEFQASQTQTDSSHYITSGGDLEYIGASITLIHRIDF